MLNEIKIKNYRNIENLALELSEGANVVIAPNSSGKTNLLESIYASIYGTSFKTIESIVEVIGPNDEFAKVTLEWEDSNTEMVISNVNSDLVKNYYYNSKPTNLTKLRSLHSAVVFAPDSVDIVSGDPSLRRNDLNNFLSSISSDYSKTILSYNKILKNRNALLKIIRAQKASIKELEFWTNKLIDHALIIKEIRGGFFEAMQPFIEKVVKEMNIFIKSEDYKYLNLNYLPNLNFDRNNFKVEVAKKFSENIDKEIIVGKTLYGIHKDDYNIFIKDRNIRFFGSRGQQRLATLLIKLAQIEYSKDTKKVTPLFLIDDLMSELDESNRNKVAEYLVKINLQFILTTAEKLEIPEYLEANSSITLL